MEELYRSEQLLLQKLVECEKYPDKRYSNQLKRKIKKLNKLMESLDI